MNLEILEEKRESILTLCCNIFFAFIETLLKKIIARDNFVIICTFHTAVWTINNGLNINMMHHFYKIIYIHSHSRH